MTTQNLIGRIYDKISRKDVSQWKGRIAVQCNVTDCEDGVFYIEILDGKLSVMPYEYIDRDAMLSASMRTYEDLLSGAMPPQLAVARGLVKVQGNIDKVVALTKLFL